MFRLTLARHGCRTMLRDEAAKDIQTVASAILLNDVVLKSRKATHQL